MRFCEGPGWREGVGDGCCVGDCEEAVEEATDEDEEVL